MTPISKELQKLCKIYDLNPDKSSDHLHLLLDLLDGRVCAQENEIERLKSLISELTEEARIKEKS